MIISNHTIRNRTRDILEQRHLVPPPPRPRVEGYIFSLYIYIYNAVRISRSHDSVYEHLPRCDRRTVIQQTWSFTHFFQLYANVLDTAHQTLLKQKVPLLLLFLTCPPITFFYSSTHWLQSHLHCAPWTCFSPHFILS
jgi:hypothetical protein